MVFKKFISAMIAVTMLMSMSVFSLTVSATDLTDDNKSTGYVTEIKGQNLGAWTRTHTGPNGQARSSVTMQLKSGQSATNGTGLINAHQTGSPYADGKYAHASFRAQASNSWQIRLRNSGGNYQYVNFLNNGSVTTNSPGSQVHDTGVTWTVAPNPGANVPAYNNSSIADYYNYIEIVKNMDTHTAYVYVNDELATYTSDSGVGNDWRGYLIYTVGSWSEYDYVIWRNGESQDYNYTIYDDTAEHTVTIEDVLNDKRLSPSSDDTHFLFSSNDASDYTVKAVSTYTDPNTSESSSIDASVTFPATDSVTITGDCYDEREGGWCYNYMRMFSGDGYKEETALGGDLLYLSYTQRINNAVRIETRIRSNNSNNGSNRLYFVPDGGKIRVGSFSNERITLNKNWDDTSTVDVGIVIDRSAHKVYTFIDGEQLGDAFNFSGDFQDLRLYMNGTPEDSVASVTYTNWLLKQYDSTKERNELFAEIRNKKPVYYRDLTDISVDGGDITTTVAVKKRFDRTGTDVDGAQVYVAAYNEDGVLVNFAQRAYSEDATNVVFDNASAADGGSLKIFCFAADRGALTDPIVKSISLD